MNNINKILRRGWILAIILYYAEVSINEQETLKEAIETLSREKNNANLLRELNGNVTDALEDLRWNQTINANYQRRISLTKKGRESIEEDLLKKFDKKEKEQLEKISEGLIDYLELEPTA